MSNAHAGSETRTERPWGGWLASLSAADIAAGAVQFSELRTFGDAVFWLESRPNEGGRVTLLRALAGVTEELTPAPASLRTRVHEYGGAPYLPTAMGFFFVDDSRGELCLLHPGDAAGASTRVRALTCCGGRVRFADLALDARRNRLIAVCERPGTSEPENLLVALSLAGPPVGPDDLEVLHHGHDFYAAPRLSAQHDRIAFVAWDHPNMPWDGTLLYVADLSSTGACVLPTLVAGGAQEAVQQPVWCDDGALVFLSDASGYWNPWLLDASGVRAVLEDGADYGEAPWALGGATLVPLGDAWLAAVRRVDHGAELVLINRHTGFASPLPCEHAEISQLCASGAGLAFISGRSDRPAAIMHRRLQDGVETALALAPQPSMPPGTIALPRRERFRTRDGATISGLFYAPTHPDHRGPDEPPPLLVLAHGGPTARVSAALNLRTQFFTARGWAVLDVDYRGSSGHGRASRDALNGRWGALDADDCEDAARALVHAGRVDARRIAIRGSSAGGLTVLAALARGNTFGAGISVYGIGDLVALARATHKFESRYVDTLVGDAAAQRQRSPIHLAGRIRSPVLLLQGSDDRVVPPEQASAMVDTLTHLRVPVACVMYPGEGHGFRRADTLQHALLCEYAFLCRAFGIEPAEPLPALEIDLP
ncbi:MAG: prolyl oligopeptidase family serine peptidase [Gammaproteobacteria bacterium]